MTEITQNPALSLLSDAAGYDPIEGRLRASVRATIETMFEEELAEFLGRMRYGRAEGAAKGYRHGHRERQLTGTFGTQKPCACHVRGSRPKTARSRNGARRRCRATVG